MTTEETGPSRAVSTVVPFVRRHVRPGADHTPHTASRADLSIPGRHYAYARYTSGLRPVAWPNTDTIEIHTSGELPDTFADILDDTITTLASVTSLPLHRAEPRDADADDATGSRLRGITVQVVDLAGLAHRLGHGARSIRGRTRGYTETLVDGVNGQYELAVVSLLRDAQPDVLARDMRHQLGHALGLAHCYTTRALMSAAPDPDITDYQPYDLTGLKMLYTLTGQTQHSSAGICMSTSSSVARRRKR